MPAYPSNHRAAASSGEGQPKPWLKLDRDHSLASSRNFTSEVGLENQQEQNQARGGAGGRPV
jgi:hypothetical protein